MFPIVLIRNNCRWASYWELAVLQPFGEQAQAGAVPEDQFHSVGSLARKQKITPENGSATQLFLHQRSPSIPLRKSTGFVAINNFSFNYLPLGEDRSVTRFGPSALAIRASNDAGLLGRTREPGSAPLLGHGLVVPAAKWVKGRERIAAAAS